MSSRCRWVVCPDAVAGGCEVYIVISGVYVQYMSSSCRHSICPDAVGGGCKVYIVISGVYVQ